MIPTPSALPAREDANDARTDRLSVLSEDILHTILQKLDLTALVNFAATSKTLLRKCFLKTPHVMKVKLLTWNLKFDEAMGKGKGHGGPQWPERVKLVAKTIRAEKPDVFCTQEDTKVMCDELLRVMESDDDSNRGGGGERARYAHFCNGKVVQRVKQMYRELKPNEEAFVTLLPGENEQVDAYERRYLRSGEGDGEGGETESAEREKEETFYPESGYLNNVWWREDRFEFVDGGMFRFKVPMNSDNPFGLPPMTWVMLRNKASKKNEADQQVETDSFIACSVHLPAGHDWDWIPYKVSIAKCVRCAVAELQVTFGVDVPIFAMGDFNSQKIAEVVKVLNGEIRKVSLEDSNNNNSINNGKAMSIVEKYETKAAAARRMGAGVATTSFSASSRPRANGLQSSALHKQTHADFVDCFEALSEDNPIIAASEPTVTPLNAYSSDYTGIIKYDETPRIRTGGLNGTTWHNWNGPANSEHVSDEMAKQAKHAQGLFAVNNGNGFVRAQAVGHERHIDHIYFVRGETLRPKITGNIRTLKKRKQTMSLQNDQPSSSKRRPRLLLEPKIRVQKCKVILDINETTPLYHDDTIEFDERTKKKKNTQRTVWASDHFPVAAVVLLSAFHRENEKHRARLRDAKEDVFINSDDEDDESNRRFRCATP